MRADREDRVSRGLRAALLALVCLLGANAAVPTALARQDQIEDDSGRFDNYAVGYESPPALDLKEVRALVSIVELPADQRPLIDDLVQSYLDKLRTNRRKMGKWYEATFMPNGQWINDAEVWEKSRPITEKYNKHIQKLRENLLEDVKLLLSPEQLDRWPKVEARLKRRDFTRAGGNQIGLASVDVEALVLAALGPDVPLPADTADALSGYQEALDRAAAIAEQWKPEDSKIPNPANVEEEAEGDDEARGRRMQGAWFARALEQWKPVRDANLAAFRRVLPTLPEDARQKLRYAFYSRASGSYARTFGDDLDFDRVENVRGLSADQKTRIAEARRSFEKLLADKLEREALEEIKAQDEDPIAFGGNRDHHNDWAKRWQEKIDNERPTRDALHDILTPEQHEAAGLGKKSDKKLEVPTFEKE
ncbi:MAG: hypothetical protein ACKVZJ_07150 [Phycisphaerales bacterium]